jgi:ethanolamine utilization protein EutP (predicted NTPase)
MRVLACGGRDYFDRQVIYTTLTKLHRENQVTVLVHGGASGADTLASEWAATMGVPVSKIKGDVKNG